MKFYIFLLVLASASAGQFEGADIIEMTSTACENFDLNLFCPPGMSISVYYADYGRSNTDYCLDSTGTVLYEPNINSGPTTTYTDCHSVDSTLQIIKTSCDNKSGCSISASNVIFGDPCPGTYKYLTVSYQCKNVASDTSGAYTSYTCENFNGTLQCPSGTTIRIKQADYGRSNSGLCVDYPVMSGNVYQPTKSGNECTQNTACHYGAAYWSIADSCDYLNTCIIPAENYIFGDPCVNTYKYLKIKYVCVEDTEVTENPYI